MTFELLLSKAIRSRCELLNGDAHGAFRLFNGFLEGFPHLVIDVFGNTAVVHSYAKPWQSGNQAVETVARTLEAIPRIDAIVLKVRHHENRDARNGIRLHGTELTSWICENGVRYSLDLTLNQDSSFYIDTRNVRRWLQDHLKDARVLNTFAYTGSLGAAATAGGAQSVVHLDVNRTFLNVAKTTYTLNGFPIDKRHFLAVDFFVGVSRMKRRGALFDCVILDPPFFSDTGKGRVDMSDSQRLINKVRPLVADNGWLVVVNNALYVSGAVFLQDLEMLCEDGYLSIEELIPVPEDVTGYPETRIGKLVTDPAPFNHATKIAVMRVRRKT